MADDNANPGSSSNFVNSARNSPAYPCEVTFGPNASVACRYMFSNNRKVVSVKFEGRPVTLGNYAFTEMRSCALFDLSLISTPSSTGSDSGKNTGADVPDGNRKILVPQGRSAAYAAAKPWSVLLSQTAGFVIEEVAVTHGTGTIEIKAGSYNVRIASAADTGNNVWDVRAPKLKQSIQNIGFDIFGLQEVQTVQQNYLESELGDVYDFAFFCANTSANRSSTGIAWKKSEYSLNGLSTYWISPTPEKIGAYDKDSSGSYYRGALAGTVTHKATGVKFFFMCTHGCLDQTCNETYAQLYIDKEAELNPSGLPSFFVGDMNAIPDWASCQLWRSYWNDTYLTLDSSLRSGPECPYNGFSYPDGKTPYRIDQLYFRGDGITPLSYTCDNTLYDGIYPSDHFPVYAVYRITQ